jgi:hypothetical protein
MRKLSELSKDQQKRIKNYVIQWPTLSAKQLGDDLYLKSSSIAAIRAHITRNLNSRFDQALQKPSTTSA